MDQNENIVKNCIGLLEDCIGEDLSASEVQKLILILKTTLEKLTF
jgi:hypothetical protein